MDISKITERLGLGDGIWASDRMALIAAQGYTHIIDLQMEFDDTELAKPFGIAVLWNPTEDDFEPKPAEFFQRSVEFARQALEDDAARLYVHCAAGVHRAPITMAAILCASGFDLDDAIQLIQGRRPVADFPPVYVASLREYVETVLEQPRDRTRAQAMLDFAR